ncbi:MAG TPA: hypothetical protein VJV79_33145 [Polyangiaceae bacterium]|nr:hypothetical protein [Polyangiaceae bacterium]
MRLFSVPNACWIGASVALLAACGASKAPALPAAQQITSASAIAALPSPPSRATDPQQEKRLAEMDHVLDWRSTVFVKGQPAIKPARRAMAGAFPYGEIVSARAFGFGHARSLSDRCGYRAQGKLSRTPDAALPFAPDGTLCPDVIAPSAVVSASDLKSILEAMHGAEAAFASQRSVTHLRCDFEAHHALVFYDEHDAPVGKLVACLTCGEVLAVPGVKALGGEKPTLMPADLSQALRRAFEQAELAVWMYDDEEFASARAYRKQAQVPGDDAAAPGSGLDPSRTLTQLSSDERTRLCVWFQEEAWAKRAPDRLLRPGASSQCQDGRIWTIAQTAQDCHVAANCTASVREVEACLRELLQDDLCTPESPACAKVHGCLPGVRQDRP